MPRAPTVSALGVTAALVVAAARPDPDEGVAESQRRRGADLLDEHRIELDVRAHEVPPERIFPVDLIHLEGAVRWTCRERAAALWHY